MIKIDKDNVKMEGQGTLLIAELSAGTMSVAFETAEMSKGKLSKKECVLMTLAMIKSGCLHILKEEEGK